MPLPGWLLGRGGNPEGFCHREMLDTVRYFVDDGTKWRAMPADFPPWQAVYAFQRRWQTDELLDVLHDRLREQVRMVEGRDDPEPTAAIIDSQSLKGASTLVGDRRGYGAGKQVSGAKRQITMDCLGLLLVVMVTAAALQNRDAGVDLLERMQALFAKVSTVWADSGYTGALVDWVLHALALKVEVTRRTDDQAGFVVVPRRWFVERTFAWLVNCRRFVRDYERTAAAHESYVKWAMVTLMTRRLAAAERETARAALARPT
ncbi:IS5 family transposase [Streptomyces sp. NPDC002734]|uniref:IS5 family transposase n=1 Tax=Streptomyces sp. NPDC002734 TaxID=3154426 RepID=UPI00331C001E